MTNEKKQQARNLFLQTDLSKTQIANTLGISRRSLYYWIQEENWDRLKVAGQHLPAMMAERCYYIFGHLTEKYLSDMRPNPVSAQEVDTLHKLVLTINKLKNRSTVNESMEMFGFFIDKIKRKKPHLAAEIAPLIDEFVSKRADVYISDFMPDNFNNIGRLKYEEEDKVEKAIDRRTAYFSDPGIVEAYKNIGKPLPTDEELINPPPGMHMM